MNPPRSSVKAVQPSYEDDDELHERRRNAHGKVTPNPGLHLMVPANSNLIEEDVTGRTTVYSRFLHLLAAFYTSNAPPASHLRVD